MQACSLFSVACSGFWRRGRGNRFRGLSRTAQERLPVRPEDAGIFDELNLHAEAGQIEPAQKIFRKLQATTHAEGGLHRMVWNTMLKAHANAGDVPGARALFEAMKTHSVTPNRQTFGKLGAIN
ncbi:unnamed protein product [Durusdinium trenchii]|uniref:Uncharacterized protein n=1 Tax=Durusdinium trenchii TaxID=1381693 RepID=A0ABP0NSX2_9DINO